MGESSQASDVELLRHTVPSWGFAAVWTAVSSGPDRRRLVAIKGETVLGAWNADDLASQIVATQLAEALREDDEAESGT
jgi:hypothetical protein